MKRLTLFFFLAFITCVTVNAQPCLTNGITFTTQAEIDSFQVIYPNCTKIGGDVNISGEDIKNLDGLSVLTNILGSLDISGNDSLVSISGLDNLTFIGGYFQIGYYSWRPGCIGNNSLLNIDCLSNLDTIGGDFQSNCNESLVSIDGFDNLKHVGGRLIIGSASGGRDRGGGNQSLNSISGFNNLVYIGGSLEIGSNGSLPGISGFERLDSISGSVEINNNDILTSFTGLDSLSYIGGSLKIGSNGSLPGISGFETLGSISGSVEINNNDVLTSFTGLDSLSFLGGSLNIANNNNLTSISGFNNLDSIGGLGIFDNDSLANISGFGNLVTVGGSLNLENNASLTDIYGLINLSLIRGNLTIDNNDALTNLMGLNNLNSILSGNPGWKSLYIVGNDALASLSGLENLTTIGLPYGTLSISNNNSLTTLYGIDQIDSESIYSLTITENSLLTTCEILSVCEYLSDPYFLGETSIHTNAQGCNSAQEVEEACTAAFCLTNGITFLTQAEVDNFQVEYPDCINIMGDLTITGPGITNLEGLAQLKNIYGGLYIGGNDQLTNLSGLENITIIGNDLIIGYSPAWGNPILTDITGLENITSVERDLYIRYNETLSDCDISSICRYLVNPSGEIYINNNASGCNSKEEVEIDCTVSNHEFNFNDKIEIYPNPFTNSTTIEYKLSQPEIVRITFYNNFGKQVDVIEKRQQKGLNEVVWTPENLADGIYYFTIGTGRIATGRLEAGEQIARGKVLKVK